MNIKIGENKSQRVTNETVNGVTVDIYLYHGTANTAFLSSAFVPEEVQLKVELKRKSGNMQIVADNLQVLGLFSALNYGNADWTLGNVLTYPAVGVKSSKLFSLTIPFGGPINLKGDDELIITAIAGRSTFSSAVDTSISNLEFNYNTCIGYEMATPQIRSQVVQAAIGNEKYSLGDNVTKIVFLNLDKDVIDESSQVINTCSLQSDKLTWTKTWNTLWNSWKNMFTPPAIALRYGQTQPMAADQALPYAPRNPQTMVLFASPDQKRDALKNCQLNISYNTTNVTASKNYIVWIAFYQDAETLQKAVDLASKHAQINVSAIPTVEAAK